MPEVRARPSRSERLDALPFTREHRRVLVGSGLGWALDAMDVGLISFVLAQLAVQWQVSDVELSWIASAGFVGMAIGAVLGGLLADRIGRRQVFALTLLVYGLATGASALSETVAVLIAWRFIVGLGLGGELPVASTLVSEFAPPRIRGRIIVILESFWAIGWTVSAVIGYLVVPSSADGWRWALAVGAVPAVYAVVVRLRLPESVRFLESRGRLSEAESTVRRFEKSAGITAGPYDSARPAKTGEGPNKTGSRTRVTALWSRGLRRRTGALWLVWFCVNFSYYGAFIWLPTILVASGYSLVRSFAYTLIITVAQLPGYAASAYLIERWGRRRTLAVFLAGSALAAALFAVAGDATQVIGAGMLLSFFNLGAWGALYAVTPELYPTRIRATGAGWAAGVGRIAAILAPLAVPMLREMGGTAILFTVFAMFFVVAALGALGLPEKRGEALED
ncbi:MFS transporter [Cryobacterium sp. TMT1-62]|uniref:MFS transporter n=1 Tax=Cryobacterium sandaracinum TaxID=1259247 RepID=A0ABY2JJ10_9MICO|nr:MULTISPECIES: MFS transporter [Cryobacterium]TFB59158.1 MFS transporter [Cryobacterium sp. Sr3]TFC34757.1 MFS transporter [Cryobacterium sp. TMT2-14]TFC66392.1 MFS transporter [Cryobacterium sp. TMT2-4]TFD07184.1 MFS transporter [Cryobacterium sandaracinum]TFD29524.1 MFS transporter [Cryobacterium sp. TMT1-62]